ncbi:MAG: hypothetical protein CL867_11315 [Cytophagaceae bacterium]|nr:hypothetical protein [Cytophagaceae bacterium]
MNKGVSRKSRENKALRPEYFAVEERSILDKMLFSLAFAKDVNYYNSQNEKEGDWFSFFDKDAAFAVAKIINAPIKHFKAKSDALLTDPKQFEHQIPELLENAFAMTAVVVDWYNTLKQTTYTGILLGELEALKEDIKPNLSKIKDIALSQAYTANTAIAENTAFKMLASHDMFESLPAATDSTVGVSHTLLNAFDHIYGKMLFLQERAKEGLQIELEARSDHLPHIALLLTFFKLSQHLETDINTLTRKHLAHYYNTHLKLKNNGIVRGSALLELSLQKGIDQLQLTDGASILLSWASGQEHTFSTTGVNHINNARVTAIKSLFKSDKKTLLETVVEEDQISDILYQSDTLAHLQPDKTIDERPRSPLTFGSNKDYPSDIGFVISSPALVLEDGNQEIVVSITINSKEHTNSQFRERFNAYFKTSFDVYITDKRGWEKVVLTSTRFEQAILKFTIPLVQDRHRLIPFDSAIHEGSFTSQWPCIKILLNNYSQIHPYSHCQFMAVEDIKIEASVKGVNSSVLSNPSGNLDSSIPFMPFGPLPDLGSYLSITNGRVFQRNLKELCIHLHWSGLPQHVYRGFETYYDAYPNRVENKSFKALLTQDRTNIYSQEKTGKQEIALFEEKEGYLVSERKIKVDLNEFPLSNRMTLDETGSNTKCRPLYMALSKPAMGFGHQLFPELYAERALRASRYRKREIALPKNPYTPIIEKLTLDYKNVAKENLKRKQDSSNTDIEFIHIYPFGHITTFPGSLQMYTYLLPQIEHRGNLFLGLEKVTAGATINLGFDLIPATWVHTAIKKPTIVWQYLLYNEWKPFGEFLLQDSTGGLSVSGIIKLRLPEVVQYNNSRMPLGQFWIRASYTGSETVNSRVKNIFAQAISISGVLDTYDSNKKREGKVKTTLVNTVSQKQIATISEPYAFKISDTTKDTRDFYTHVSEQLRHKNRGVTNWDIERLVLDKFKEVDKLRVFGRCTTPNELIIGNHLQVVVIPKIASGVQSASANVKMPLEVLENIKRYVMKFVSPHLKISVSIALYERLKVRCRVRFIPPENSGYLRDVLNEDLVNYISPYLENAFIDKGFDQSISKMEVLNFVESRPYVDEVSHFSVLQLIEVNGTHRMIDTARPYGDKLPERLHPISPYVILSSVAQHHIEIIQDTPVAQDYKITGIGDAAIGTDFIMTDSAGKYMDS